jgi:hypothetical protein
MTAIDPQFTLEDAGKGIEGKSGAIAQIFLGKVLPPSFVRFRLLFCRPKLLPSLGR